MPRGLIVVGVDGSENSRQALRWAFDEARLRQAQVRFAQRAIAVRRPVDCHECCGTSLLFSSRRRQICP
jgi:nucleotide-binding universal stress UspA family protein